MSADASETFVDSTNSNGVLEACTSGVMNPGGGSLETMNPGMPCISCHAANEGPSFQIAGTVYSSASDPDQCAGVDGGGVQVIIVDANGQTYSLGVNSVGNFYYPVGPGTIAFPIAVSVAAQGAQRSMSAQPMSGDCNSCHTEDGANGAPGRVMAPQ
jgi:hypothetical protein